MPFISYVFNTISSFFARYYVLIVAHIISTLILSRLPEPRKTKTLNALFFRFTLIIINVSVLIKSHIFLVVIMALTSVLDECTA